MNKLPDWHPMAQFGYVSVAHVYPGGRKQLRITHEGNVVTVDKAIELLAQNSDVYIYESDLAELNRRWKP